VSDQSRFVGKTRAQSSATMNEQRTAEFLVLSVGESASKQRNRSTLSASLDEGEVAN